MGEFSPVHWLIVLFIFFVIFIMPLWLIVRALNKIAAAVDRTNETLSRSGSSVQQAIKDGAVTLAIGDSKVSR